MTKKSIRTQSYFDGDTYHNDGPYIIGIENGKIARIEKAGEGAQFDIEVPFIMPSLTEAHCHIFLDGGELDFKIRNDYFKSTFDEMMEVARKNVELNQKAGIGLIRDAGDKYGINDAIRAELKSDEQSKIHLRSPSLGLRRAKRYGGFMAREVEENADFVSLLNDISKTSDDIKIILTGIIDFEAGNVKGAPQFNFEELSAIVSEAHKHGRKTYAHCSGVEGLDLAVEAGVDSIEHGFFMTDDALAKMRDKNLAWVPTFSPVHFQWAHPESSGWDENTIGNLRKILDAHSEYVGKAAKMGVNLVAGSDAGSPGVVHGTALINELYHFLDAGVPMIDVLKSTTSRPRELWKEASNNIKIGNKAELIALEKSPFEDEQALRKVIGIY